MIRARSIAHQCWRVTKEGEPTRVEGGGLYDPATDRWRPVSTEGAPANAHRSESVWTGTEMIVWGGGGRDPVNTGGVYDAALDEWRPTSLENAPSPRSSPACVWTGRAMFVWGGRGPDSIEDTHDGALYDPVTDQWRRVSADGAPTGDAGIPLWTGTEVLLTWEGPEAADQRPDTRLSSYEPASDRWTDRPVDPRLLYATAVWTGSRTIYWVTSEVLPEADVIFGGEFDPLADAWNGISQDWAPSLTNGFSAVWTGEEMIVWGGATMTGNLGMSNIGARYRPSP